jgi:hypothetical protein
MRTALLCSLLGLSLAGCGLFQVTVNGKVVRGPGSEEAKAAEAAAANGTTADASASGEAKPAKLPARDVKLADAMPEPVVLEGKHTGELMVPVKVVTKTPRKISVVVLGGYAYQDQGYSGSTRLDNVKVTPEEPLVFDVKSAQGPDPRPWHVVIADDEQTFLSGKTVVYGNPRAGAKLEERQLGDYSVLGSNMGQRLVGGQSQRSPEFAAELFTSVDERFFVWLKKERSCYGATGPISTGEPLLLDSFSGNSSTFRRANGERADCNLDDVELDVTTTRPGEIVMPPAVPPAVSETQNLWSDEEFLPLASEVPRIAAYKERKAKVSECWNREWEKHDPDGKAGDYDVIQYDSRGQIKKVESMSDRIMRKVDKVCKFTALEKERDGIREQLRKEGEAKSAKELEGVAARFAKK